MTQWTCFIQFSMLEYTMSSLIQEQRENYHDSSNSSCDCTPNTERSCWEPEHQSSAQRLCKSSFPKWHTLICHWMTTRSPRMCFSAAFNRKKYLKRIWIYYEFVFEISGFFCRESCLNATNHKDFSKLKASKMSVRKTTVFAVVWFGINSCNLHHSWHFKISPRP